MIRGSKSPKKSVHVVCTRPLMLVTNYMAVNLTFLQVFNNAALDRNHVNLRKNFDVSYIQNDDSLLFINDIF